MKSAVESRALSMRLPATGTVEMTAPVTLRGTVRGLVRTQPESERRDRSVASFFIYYLL